MATQPKQKPKARDNHQLSKTHSYIVGTRSIWHADEYAYDESTEYMNDDVAIAEGEHQGIIYLDADKNVLFIQHEDGTQTIISKYHLNYSFEIVEDPNYEY